MGCSPVCTGLIGSRRCFLKSWSASSLTDAWHQAAAAGTGRAGWFTKIITSSLVSLGAHSPSCPQIPPETNWDYELLRVCVSLSNKPDNIIEVTEENMRVTYEYSTPYLLHRVINHSIGHPDSALPPEHTHTHTQRHLHFIPDIACLT